MVGVGSFLEAVGATETDDQTICGIGFYNVVAVRILGQFVVSLIQQRNVIVTAALRQVGDDVLRLFGCYCLAIFLVYGHCPSERPGGNGRLRGRGRGFVFCVDVEHRATRKIRQDICRFPRLSHQAPSHNGRVCYPERFCPDGIIHVAADHVEGRHQFLANNAYGAICEEHQVTGGGIIGVCLRVSAQFFPTLGHCPGAYIAGELGRVGAGVMQAVGNKHCGPIAIGRAVPSAITGVAPAHAVIVNGEVLGTFSIAHLGLGNAGQVLADVARIGIGGKHLLPIQLGLHIGGVIGITGQGVAVFFLRTGRFAIFIVGVFYDAAICIAGQRQARLPQHPEHIQRNNEGERKQNRQHPHSAHSVMSQPLYAFAQDILHCSPSFLF